jgi:hypothetical protein
MRRRPSIFQPGSLPQTDPLPDRGLARARAAARAPKITAAHRHAIETFDRFPLDAEEIEVIGKFGETPNDLSAL